MIIREIYYPGHAERHPHLTTGDLWKFPDAIEIFSDNPATTTGELIVRDKTAEELEAEGKGWEYIEIAAKDIPLDDGDLS